MHGDKLLFVFNHPRVTDFRFMIRKPATKVYTGRVSTVYTLIALC